MTFGLASALSSIVSGYIVKYIPDSYVIYVGLTNNVGLVLFLLFWQRVPSFLVVFLFATVWGLSDGLWNTLVPGTVCRLTCHAFVPLNT